MSHMNNKLLLIIPLVFTLMLVPAFAQEYSDNSPTKTVWAEFQDEGGQRISPHKNSTGFLIGNGFVTNEAMNEHGEKIDIHNVVVQVKFYDRFSNTPVEIVNGTTIDNIIPKQGRVAFSISSLTNNTNLDGATVSVLSFDTTCAPDFQGACVQTDKSLYSKNDPVLISGHIADSQTQAFWLSIESDDEESNYGNIVNFNSTSREYFHPVSPVREGFETGDYTVYAWKNFRQSVETTFTYSALTVLAEDGQDIPGVGKVVHFNITGAKGATEIKIIDSNQIVIGTLNAQPSNTGEIDMPWLIPIGTPSGTLTIEVTDSLSTTQTPYEHTSTPNA